MVCNDQISPQKNISACQVIGPETMSLGSGTAGASSGRKAQALEVDPGSPS